MDDANQRLERAEQDVAAMKASLDEVKILLQLILDELRKP